VRIPSTTSFRWGAGGYTFEVVPAGPLTLRAFGPGFGQPDREARTFANTSRLGYIEIRRRLTE
jgi:hypothetical protein